MKRIVHAILLGVVVGILAWPAVVLADKPVIIVSTVDELYTEVNDPANMNVVIQLMADTTYALSADSYPNGGRLVLQPGMDLVGENEYTDLDGDGVWDPLDGTIPTPSSDFVVSDTETIIDGQGISSGDQGDLIVVGHDNLIKKLTIKNMPYGGYALIGSSANDPPQAGQGKKVGWKFRVVDCLLENDLTTEFVAVAEMGIDCVNRGDELNGANTKCTLTGNIARNLPNIGGFAPDGIRIRNSGVDDARIHATLRGNRLYSIPGRPDPGAEPEAGHGLAVYGADFFGGDNNEVRVVSIGNVYSECGVGSLIIGGFPLFGAIATGNHVHVTSNNDQIINNYAEGGVGILGGLPIVFAAAYDNEAVVEMLGTVFVSGRQPENIDEDQQEPPDPPRIRRKDLLAEGADPIFNSVAQGNKVRLLLRGALSNGEPAFFIFMDDPHNEVTLVGSEKAVEKANEGVELIIFP